VDNFLVGHSMTTQIKPNQTNPTPTKPTKPSKTNQANQNQTNPKSNPLQFVSLTLKPY
tara:strand:- start:15 stop:188 length:174 start_codon:yes stop_codon:yes gene_type:complete